MGGGIASYPQGINSAGEWKVDDWKGLFTSWDALYFFSGDPTLRNEMLASANLTGRFPLWFREADHSAGSGKYFDYPKTGHVDTYGRVISVNPASSLRGTFRYGSQGVREKHPTMFTR